MASYSNSTQAPLSRRRGFIHKFPYTLFYSRPRRSLFPGCLEVWGTTRLPLSGLLMRLLGGRNPLALDGRGRRRESAGGWRGEGVRW